MIDRRPRAAAVTVLAVLAAGLAATGAGVPQVVVVVVAGAVWNGAFGPVASTFQTAAVRIRAVSPDLAGAWVVSTSNVGIAAGAAVGGLLLTHTGTAGVGWFGAGVVTLAVGVVVAARSTFPRTPVA